MTYTAQKPIKAWFERFVEPCLAKRTNAQPTRMHREYLYGLYLNYLGRTASLAVRPLSDIPSLPEFTHAIEAVYRNKGWTTHETGTQYHKVQRAFIQNEDAMNFNQLMYVAIVEARVPKRNPHAPNLLAHNSQLFARPRAGWYELHESWLAIQDEE